MEVSGRRGPDQHLCLPSRLTHRQRAPVGRVSQSFGQPVGFKHFHHYSVALAVLSATLSGRLALGQLAPDLDPSRLVADQVAGLARQMSDPTLDQDARDLAASRLISIDSPQARAAIMSALKDPGNFGGRLAAARAIAETLPPDPQFVDPLFVLFDAGQRRELVDAAVIALGNYKTQPDVNARLILLTGEGSPDAVRIAAIRTLGHHAEKAGVQRLVALADDGNPQVSFAAIDALQMVTGLGLTTSGDWLTWWNGQSDRTPDAFRTELLAARASTLEREKRQRGDEAIGELRRTVEAAIASAGNGQLGEILNRYLTSPREAYRMVAAGQAYQLATTGDLPAVSRPVVRSLISDPNPDIRLQVARTISRVNDVEAFEPIARQVAVESDPAVRAELANALGVIGNTDAIALLRWQLEDRSGAVVSAAAGALARLGPALVAKDPGAAAELAGRLRLMLEALPRTAEYARQRETLISALVPLKQRSMATVFAQMLTADPREPERIRRLAAAGLGVIGDPNTADLLVDVMSDTIASTPPVRLEAINALGRVANAFYYADALYRRMDPRFESDAEIRAAAWVVITKLFETASRDQLAAWPDKSLIKGDARKELQIFQSLAAKAEAANDQNEYTQRLEQIGDSYMVLGESSNPPERDEFFSQATANFQKALDLTRANLGRAGQVERLIDSTLKSMLRGRRYNEAASFASSLLSDPANQQFQVVVGPAFRLEAERLFRQVGQGEDALALIREALAIRPALASHYVDQLSRLQQEIERGRSQKNQLAVPEVFDALAAR